MDIPPPIPPRPPGYELPPQQQQQQLAQHQYQQPPPPQQTPQYYQQYIPAGFPPPPQQPQPPPSKWCEHLFYSNGNPAPAFQALMKQFFLKLDPQQTDYITPEAFTSFLDACQYRIEHDVWKRSLKGNLMFAAEDMADFELKAALEGFYFDHKVFVRNPTAKQLPYGGMPLLSLAGFTDFMAVEFGSDPDAHLSGLNNALRHYGIWPDKGPIPRYIMPAMCPPELQRRIDEATVRCQSASVEKLNAQKAQAMLAQRGQQNALDLLTDYRYG